MLSIPYHREQKINAVSKISLKGFKIHHCGVQQTENNFLSIPILLERTTNTHFWPQFTVYAATLITAHKPLFGILKI